MLRMEYQSLVNRVSHFTIKRVIFTRVKFNLPDHERHQVYQFSEEFLVATEDFGVIAAPIGLRQKKADWLNPISGVSVLPRISPSKERIRRWHAKHSQSFRRGTDMPHLICVGVAPHTIKI